MASKERPQRPPVILVAMDQEWAARSLDSILAPNGFAVLRANSGAEVIELARSTKPDAIIIDTAIGNPVASEVCRILREEQAVTLSTPIVVTAPAAAGRAQRLSAYAAGAWQFWSQPLDGEALVLQLTSFLEAKREADWIREQNLLDEESGLYSIKGLARRAVEIGADAQRRGLPVTCIAFEPEIVGPPGARVESIDARRVAGNIGDICRRMGRVSDATGRIGQCEFAIVASVADPDGAVRVIERLQSALDTVASVGRGPNLRLRAGYHHVSNFADSPIDAVEMLLRAATALRRTRGRPADRGAVALDQLPSVGAG